MEPSTPLSQLRAFNALVEPSPRLSDIQRVCRVSGMLIDPSTCLLIFRRACRSGASHVEASTCVSNIVGAGFRPKSRPSGGRCRGSRYRSRPSQICICIQIWLPDLDLDKNIWIPPKQDPGLDRDPAHSGCFLVSFLFGIFFVFSIFFTLIFVRSCSFYLFLFSQAKKNVTNEH